MDDEPTILGDHETYTDVLVIADAHTHPALADRPPAGRPAVRLVPGLTLERLPRELAESVIDAATPRGRSFSPARQFGQRYSFVRRGPLDQQDLFTFDPDGLIRTAVQLSRLVIPNGHSTDYAARVLPHQVFPFKDEPGPTIAPLPPEDREFAFTPAAGARDWLTEDEARELGRHLQRWLAVREALPQRVKNAMWLSEWTARTAFIQPAFVNTVSALEALMSTGGNGQRAQFVVRCLAATLELDDPEVDVDAPLLDRTYTARSEVTHGTFVPMSAGGSDAEDLVRVQGLLRALLRRAILDGQFAEVFASAESVADRWPIPDQRWRQVLGLPSAKR